MRHALPEVDHIIEIGPRTLQWRTSTPLWLDVEEFERALAEDQLKTAVDLYAGELLEGRYDEWLLDEGERLAGASSRGTMIAASAFYWILAATLLAFGQGDIDAPGGWVVFSLAVLTSTGLGVIAWRGWRTGAAVEGALNEGLGTGWRSNLDPEIAAGLRRRLPWFRILFLPIFIRRRDVERLPNIRYGDAGWWNLRDLYRPRFQPPTGPTLVYLHGAVLQREKSREARPLLYRLASQGWVCLSANYRLRPAATFPDHLIASRRSLPGCENVASSTAQTLR